jgi:hypothetical protein
VLDEIAKDLKRIQELKPLSKADPIKLEVMIMTIEKLVE